MAKTDKPEKTDAKATEKDKPEKAEKAEAKGEAKTEARIEPKSDAKLDVKAAAALDGKIDSKFDDVKSGGVAAPMIDETPKPGDGPKSATHNELPTEPERTRTKTDSMSAVTPVGEPPSVPSSTVEDPTNMPGPKSIPSGNPTDTALPPGHVPPGDSRSLRRGNEFALVYRQGSSVITRWGTIGQRGQWRVVEYPTTSSASNSYAKECSRFVAEGFSDYRD